MASSPNDITIDCRARRTRQNVLTGECFVEFEGLMICTLCEWVPSDGRCNKSCAGANKHSWHEAMSDFACSGFSVGGPEISLCPLDPLLPSPRNNSRCRSNAFFIVPDSPQSYRIPAYDIQNVKVLGRLTLELTTATSVWELSCHTRNAHDLFLACLQARVGKVVHIDDKQRHLPGKDHESDSPESVDNIDALTERCIQQSLQRESFAEKMERRWGKAIHNIAHLVTGDV